MATITRFEDLEVWQQARELNIKVGPILERMQEIKSFGFKDQLDKSAGSVMDNIAEGFDRGGNREFIQFLSISRGSLGEVRSQLYRATDRKLIDTDENNALQEECKLLAGKISNFMFYLNSSDFKGMKFKK